MSANGRDRDSTFQKVEKEPKASERVNLIEAADYVDTLMSLIQDAEDEIALHTMDLDINSDKISPLIQLLIEKKKENEDIEITIACTRTSVKDMRDEIRFNELYNHGINIKWTEEQDASPYKNKNHRKLAVIDQHVLIGGVNLTDECQTYIDWMLHYENNPLLRDIVLRKIKEESGPGETLPLEYEIYDLLSGSPRELGLHSYGDLAMYLHHAFKGNFHLALFENAYTDQESVFIETAVQMIYAAKEKVVFTGQWLPDGRVKKAIQDALLRGVRVEIISNTLMDHIDSEVVYTRNRKDKLAFGGGYAFIQSLWINPFQYLTSYKVFLSIIKDQLKIMTVRKRLVHAKMLVGDDAMVLISSDNMISPGAKRKTRESGIATDDEVIVGQIVDGVEKMKNGDEMWWSNWWGIV